MVDVFIEQSIIQGIDIFSYITFLVNGTVNNATLISVNAVGRTV